MKDVNYKQVFISILVGACIAFLSALIEGLGQFLADNATELTSGGVGAMVYLLKSIRLGA